MYVKSVPDNAEFDYVVVDTAPSVDEHVLQAIDESDELLLITTLDVPTLKNVKIAVETDGIRVRIHQAFDSFVQRCELVARAGL